MGKPYSEDLRHSVVQAIESGRTYEEAADLYGVSVSLVRRFLTRRRATGSINSHSGVDFDPSSRLLRANGNQQFNGWPNNPQIEEEIAVWCNATSSDEEKTIVRRLNRLAIDHVLYAPLGATLQHQAWRKNVSGIGQAPLPLFWGVSKTA